MRSLFILFFIAIIHSVHGQQKIIVEIQHKLGDQTFKFNQTSQNNLSHYFTLRRLDYYLSDFKVIHSGGQELNVQNSIRLISLDENQDKTIIDLGLMKVENIEKLSFMFGLDSLTNHSDPALYSIGHPLGPRFPTMHWGWASGYRFIAVEGKAGPANNQETQLHALGDQYYKPFTFEIIPEISGDTVKFILIADYNELFYNISIKQGVIVHGSDKEIVFMVDNILNRVFSTLETNATVLPEETRDFVVFPNPTSSNFQISSTDNHRENYSYILYNSLGQKVKSGVISGLQNADGLTPGMYQLQILLPNEKLYTTKSLMVMP